MSSLTKDLTTRFVDDTSFDAIIITDYLGVIQEAKETASVELFSVRTITWRSSFQYYLRAG